MANIGDAPSNSPIDGTYISTSATNLQVARQGLGVAAGATAPLTFPATTGLASGTDFGGDTYLYRASVLGASALRVERPSANRAHLNINAATGQDSVLSLSENATVQWLIRHNSSGGSMVLRDEVGSRNLISLSDTGRVDIHSESDAIAPGNAMRNVWMQRQGSTRDGRSNQGTPASDGLNRDNSRLSFAYGAAGEFANSTNGTRGDSCTTAAALTTGQSGFLDIVCSHTWDAKGALIPVYSVIQDLKKPTGTTAGTDSYNETNCFTGRIEGVRNKGAYAGCLETFLKIWNGTDEADGGPIQGFGALIQVQERNTYASYATGPLPTTTGWQASGSRGIWIHSGGTAVVGTGIHLRGSGSFKRFMVGEDAAGVEQFCIDGEGNIAVRRSENQTVTLGYALTLGYTSAGAASTVVGDGIGFGGDVELFRSAADVLRTPDALSVGGFLNLNGGAASTAFIQMYQMTANTGAAPSDVGNIYFKSDKIVIKYNNGTNTQYLTCDLSSGTPSSTWAISTSAP